MQTAIGWDMFLRGTVAGLLIFHMVHLALHRSRPAARWALGMFTLSVFTYLICQQSSVLLSLPRPLALVLLAMCVSSTAWLWVAARALFDDGFRFSPWVVALVLGLIAVGMMSAQLRLSGASGVVLQDLSGVAAGTVFAVHAVAMVGFAAAALWEIARGWQNDLVEPRRIARRWAAMGVGVYAAIALAVEISLSGQEVGQTLPLLHVAGIGMVALALAALVALRSLDDVLGVGPPTQAVEIRTPNSVPRQSATVLRLEQEMNSRHAYRREGLSLAELAKTLGAREAALREVINHELGFRNFNDFLHHYRLRDAARRLESEDLPVLTIALECGYGSIGPFNRAFRQRYGMTPTEYRGGKRLNPGLSKT
jgi:AraC-like DNA-binding protein